MKTGKYIKIAAASFLIGSYFGNRSFKKSIKQKDKITWNQYLNRLSEFCVDNLHDAQIQYVSLIESGAEYEEAFNLTILSKTTSDILYGDFND